MKTFEILCSRLGNAQEGAGSPFVIAVCNELKIIWVNPWVDAQGAISLISGNLIL